MNHLFGNDGQCILKEPCIETHLTHLGRPDARGLRAETSEVLMTAYADEAPGRGEIRPWADLGAEDQEWWVDWIERLHALRVDLAQREDETLSESVWTAYHAAGGDADSALAAAEDVLLND